MKPSPFAIATPRSVEEALELLGQYGDEARVLAGGQSLVPLMALRLAAPGVLIDIGRISALEEVQLDDQIVSIGAGVRQRYVERHDEIGKELPLLAEALPLIGHPTIRNRGTVVGSLCHADPAAEIPVVAVALDARVEVASVAGRRMVEASDFFRGYMTTALAPTEMAVTVSFHPGSEPIGTAFAEVSRRSGDFAMVAAAAVIGCDPGGAVSSVQLVLGAVSDTPLKISGLDDVLVGRSIDEQALADAASHAQALVSPMADLHATASYRRHLVGVLAHRVLRTAYLRATSHLAGAR